MNDLLCPRCSSSYTENVNFCSHCGYNLSGTLSTTLGMQLIVYLVSFFLAPFGLMFVFKYLKNGGRRERMVGVVALILTVVAIGIMLFAGTALINYQKALLNSVW